MKPDYWQHLPGALWFLMRFLAFLVAIFLVMVLAPKKAWCAMGMHRWNRGGECEDCQKQDGNR